MRTRFITAATGWPTFAGLFASGIAAFWIHEWALIQFFAILMAHSAAWQYRALDAEMHAWHDRLKLSRILDAIKEENAARGWHLTEPKDTTPDNETELETPA